MPARDPVQMLRLPEHGLIKVCGITTIEDARLSIELGAGALGFNFYPESRRYLAPEKAAAILQALPTSVLTFGIFVLKDNRWVIPRKFLGLLSGVQLHGLRVASEVPAFSGHILVAVGAEEVHRFPSHDIIIDTSWGTGRLADWELLRKLNRPYILSGGLTPENVGQAIQMLKPAGVDVCSGVEAEAGRKDPVRLERFLRAAREGFHSFESGHLGPGRPRNEST